MTAVFLHKTKWKDGKYPDPNTGLYYRTRVLVFRIEETDEIVRMNVQDRRPNSMQFNKLQLGDRIKDFRLLPNRPIIDPESPFVPYNGNALF